MQAAAVVAVLALAGCRPAAPPPSILLIVIDTLRADSVGILRDSAPGQPPSLTPEIDRWARSATVFSRAVTPAPFTMPAMASLLTGAYPDRTGVIAHEPGTSLRPWRGRVLAEAAQADGMATAAVIANPWLARSTTGFDRGFSKYSRLYHPDQPAGSSAAARVTDEAISTLNQLAGSRFLLWVHYFDPHMPYAPPAAFAAGAGEAPSRVMSDFDDPGRDLGRLYRGEGYSEAEIEQARGLYQGEVRYTDREVGRLLAHLEERGLAANTIVVVASDHGESLGEHGLYFAHDYTLYQELVRVVLMVRGPGLGAATRNDPVSLLDVTPTLCRLASLACEQSPDGRDLLAQPDPARTLFASATPLRARGTPFDRLQVPGPQGRWTMALHQNRKLVRVPTPDGPELELYDLGSDPRELRNLAAHDAAATSELAGKLDGWAAGMDAVRPEQPVAGARRQRRDARTLRSLGYLQ